MNYVTLLQAWAQFIYNIRGQMNMNWHSKFLVFCFEIDKINNDHAVFTNDEYAIRFCSFGVYILWFKLTGVHGSVRCESRAWGL